MLAHEAADPGDAFLLEARRHVDQHQGRGIHVIFTHGHEARASAHGGAHERGSPVAASEQDALEIVHHDVLIVTSLGIPVGVAVPARIERDRVIPGGRQPFAGAFPGMARLPPAMLQHHQGRIRVTPRIAGESYPLRTRPEVKRFGRSGKLASRAHWCAPTPPEGA